MGILNIFKREGNSSTDHMPKDAAPSKTLSDGEILFMIYVDGHDANISKFSQKYHYEYGFDYGKEIQKLLALGYLCINTAENSLHLYKVSELKDFLRENGESTSGNKEDLVSRIIENTSGYENYFTNRVYALTPEGRKISQQYESRRLSSLREKMDETICYIRKRKYDRIIQLYENPADPRNPISIGYTKDAIERDVSAIVEYSRLGRDSDRDLAIMVASTMYKTSYRNSLQILKDVGYDDVTEAEVHTAAVSISSLRSISELRDIGIKKYIISSCKDGRVCEKCKKMSGKKFLVADAKLGKNLPPFCEKCRCLVMGDFQS